MKHKKLKPILTGSVFLLPVFLFLSGSTQESKAMMRGALSKISSFSRINMPKFDKAKIPNLNQIKLPNTINKINVSTGKPSLGLNKSYSLKNNGTVKIPTISKSHSFDGKITSSSSSSISKLFSKNQTQATTTPDQPPKLEPRQPITNNPSVNFEKLDPGYGTVPKPIFTPKDPNKPLPEPEVYQNVVILNTNAGTLTIFKD